MMYLMPLSNSSGHLFDPSFAKRTARLTEYTAVNCRCELAQLSTRARSASRNVHSWLLVVLQLLTAVPQSSNQMWHSDNQSRGLTVIVPLVDFTLHNGATQVLARSHQSLRCLGEGAQVLIAPRGGIAAYDARVFHRGLGNTTDCSRPALVYRYDDVRTPPPGVGIAGALWNAAAATAAHLVTAAKRRLLRLASSSDLGSEGSSG